MAALSTLVELMARASATVFSQVYSNALEKAQQQQHHQQQLNLQSQQALGKIFLNKKISKKIFPKILKKIFSKN